MFGLTTLLLSRDMPTDAEGKTQGKLFSSSTWSLDNMKKNNKIYIVLLSGVILAAMIAAPVAIPRAIFQGR